MEKKTFSFAVLLSLLLVPALVEAEGSALPLRVELVGSALPGPAGKALVPVLVEINGADLMATTASGRVSLELFVYAVGPAGEPVDRLSQSLDLDLDVMRDRLLSGGLRYYGQLTLPTGSFELKVMVRQPTSGATGSTVLALTVPDFEAAGLVVATPLIETHARGGVMARQRARPGEAEPAYLFGAGREPLFVPAARGELAPGSPFEVRIPVIGVGGEGLTVTGQLVDDRGNVALGAQLVVRERLQDALGVSWLIAGLELPDLRTGDYRLSVTVVEPGSSRRSTASVPVRVGTQTQVAAQAPAQIASASPAAPPATGGSGRIKIRRRATPVERGVFEERYRRILAQLAEGAESEAALALAQFEQQSAESLAAEPFLRSLFEAEIQVARRLAAHDPSALLPVALLHEATYQRYRDRNDRLLARYSREMVRSLAELYVEKGGSPTSVAASIFTSLGGSLQQAGMTASANSLFERALELQPRHPTALLSLAVYYEKVGLYDQAIPHLEHLLEAEPNHGQARLRLGVNLLRLGKVGAARKALEACQAPDQPAWVRSLAYQELAATALAAEEWEQAEQILRAGLTALPGEPRLSLQLAMTLDRLGRPRQAREALAAVQPEGGGATGAARFAYNLWPVDQLQSERSWLVSTAAQRLPVLARAIGSLDLPETAR
ncbi:MAG TPA: tetratricopeptide repeat protein [Thermoanaerobaculia bacterium]|nr:tetratricopeptide repeat protein [Thermoanaerobaculia bacterium]